MGWDSPLLEILRKGGRKEEDIWEALWNFTSDYSKDSKSFLIIVEDWEMFLWKWHLKDGHTITGLYMGCYNDYFNFLKKNTTCLLIKLHIEVRQLRLLFERWGWVVSFTLGFTVLNFVMDNILSTGDTRITFFLTSLLLWHLCSSGR